MKHPNCCLIAGYKICKYLRRQKCGILIAQSMEETHYEYTEMFKTKKTHH